MGYKTSQKSRMLFSFAGTGLVLMLTAGVALADDWPQWRGVNRNGISAETGLMAEWPEGGPSLVWRVDGLGAGYSSVSVVGGRIFTLGDLEDGQFAMALSESDGSLLWKTHLGPVHEHEYPGPRATPTVDGDWIYVMSTEGKVVCLNAETGEERWSRSLPDDFDGYLMKAMGSYDWKFSESPLVDGDRVVVTPGHIASMLVALDKQTGEEIWRTQGGRIGPVGADGAGYSSAVISEAGGTRQYVQLVGRGLMSVDAETGKMLWGYNRVANDIANISTPIVKGDYVFASSGYGTGAALVKIGQQEDDWKAEEIYFLEADTVQNHHGGLILHDDMIFTGTGHNNGFPIALELMTGKIAWGPERNKGKDSAAITYADGRLYFRYQNGLMILVEASPEGYHEKGSFMIPDIEQNSWAHPVIANGRLLLREQDNLFSYDIEAPSQSAQVD
jgi:outer membrane protein assembly factor BamB